MLVVPAAALLLVRSLIPSFAAAPVATASASALGASAPQEDRTPEIRGRILDAEGEPVSGAAVRVVYPRPPYTVFHETTTDRAGAFSFAHVRPGRVRVVADHDPRGVVTSAELVTEEGKTTEISLVLSAAGVVRGAVVDAADHPVAGATLSVEGTPWITRTATSDAAGAFALTTVPREATSLVAVARGYRTARVPLAHREDDRELTVRVELVAAPPVDGEVRDPDGHAVRARIVACDG